MNHKKWSVSFSVLVLIIAAIELARYMTGLSLSGIINNNYIPMAPSSSYSFIILGLSALFLNKTSSFNSVKFILLTLISLVTVFGFIISAGYLLNLNIDLEKFFVSDYGFLNNIPLARMSPATGALFFISGLILFYSTISHNWSGASKVISYITDRMVLFLFLFAFIFCLAYIYGKPLLYKTESVIPMAFTTSLAFIFLSCSIITLNRNNFLLSFLVQKSTRAYLLRNILPLAVIPAFLGGITVYFATQLNYVNPAFVSSVFTILIAIKAGYISNVISRNITGVINKQQEKIRKSHKTLEKSEEMYRNLFETMAQGVVYQNANGEITSANSAAEKILGLTRDQMFGRKSIDPRWKAVDKNFNVLHGDMHPAMMALKTGEVIKDFVQGIFNPELNDYVWILVNSVPRFKEGKPMEVFSTFLDITPIHKAEMELKQFKEILEQQVNDKTHELATRVAELELFHEVTIEREIRMEELRREIEKLKNVGIEI